MKQQQFPFVADSYSFPYWSKEDRIVGQPIHQMGEKYSVTYDRVAQAMMGMEFKSLNMMGLFATNHRTIGDYLQFQFSRNGLPTPVVEQVAVVEREDSICEKIKQKELTGPWEGNLVLLNTLLKNLAWIRTSTRGANPKGFQAIQQYRRDNLMKVNFMDFDLMCNWGLDREINILPSIINILSATKSVVHINAISSFPRTLQMKKSRSEVDEILHKQIFNKLNRQVTSYSIESYETVTRAPTEMTSVVISLN